MPATEEQVAEQVRDATVFTLAQRVREVGRAWVARDENALRGELRRLAGEAGFLAACDPLLPSEAAVDRRLRIAAEQGEKPATLVAS